MPADKNRRILSAMRLKGRKGAWDLALIPVKARGGGSRRSPASSDVSGVRVATI